MKNASAFLTAHLPVVYTSPHERSCQDHHTCIACSAVHDFVHT